VEYISSPGAITARQNSVDILSATDSTYDANTFISLYHALRTSTALRMDNLVVDEPIVTEVFESISVFVSVNTSYKYAALEPCLTLRM